MASSIPAPPVPLAQVGRAAHDLGLAGLLGGNLFGRLARAKDVLVGVVAVTGAATAVEGVRFSRDAPGGAVPLRDGDHTAEGAPPQAARRKRRLNALGAASLAAEVALVGVNAALGQQNFRRPPARRLARR